MKLNSDRIISDTKGMDFLCQNGLLLGAKNFTISLVSTERSPYFLEDIMSGVKGKTGVYIRTLEQIERIKRLGLKRKGYEQTEEAKIKIGIASKQRWRNPEYRKMMKKYGFQKGYHPPTQFQKGKSYFPKYQFKKGYSPYRGSFKKDNKINLGRTGEKGFRWKGGKTKTTKGYILIYKPKHPFCQKGNYVLEHRFVMEKMIGRFLKPKEAVHHINGIKDDNRPENLQLFSHSPHYGVIVCPFCKKEFVIR
ncbi:HNH endonuclease [bacterium]|nr:MAG: HNH endonuclease [bacterium]